ncbi:hypothetical protein K402DRAFT_457295 [Aulographum hederae CBS 113979]|uniref:Uncharacterized protein n=1 Tax=Aulographum hederae CBS 113979 TaxID=1176131 RepID=A0A6G1GNM7_9PEZI|nr:hypothetical protein K402DRAFT_457295 [Aulographum hederae CBS 113979]
MAFKRFLTLALLSLRALSVVAELQVESIEEIDDDIDIDAAGEQQTPNIKVAVSASFPDSEIFGVKLINGHPTRAVFSFENDEPHPVVVRMIGGHLAAPSGPPQVVRNLTVTQYNIPIPAGEKESLTYSFATELHPQDLRLNLVSVIQAGPEGKETVYTMPIYNETVSIVEAPTSFFDPQIIFLYLVLLAVFGGTLFFIYNTWIATLFPQKKKGGKGGERAKKSSQGKKEVDPADQVSVVGADGPAVTSGSKAYDESWIPAQHLQRPEARRVKSGTPKSKSRA